MAELVDEHLARAIADIAVFLEFTPSDLLDEHASLNAMERLAEQLQSMSPEARHSLADRIRSLATSYAESPVQDFVRNLPDAFGLVD